MKKQKNKNRSVTYVLCYRDPNYVRTQSLLAAINYTGSFDVKVIKNRHKNVLRYPEVILKVIWSRFKNPSDVYFVGFRGHEIFWFIYPFIATKKIVFDEFICTFDWFTKEKKLIRPRSLLGRLLRTFMRATVNRADVVLSDTKLHAKRIETVYSLPGNKSQYVYVGTDETIFYPRPKTIRSQPFNVFFYGNMLPLHGIDIILGAIKLIKDKNLDNLNFTLVGGKGNEKMEQKVQSFIKKHGLGSCVTHIPWLEYKKLPEYIGKSHLTLGGPFGNTPQAQRVITGKTYQFLAMAAPVIIGKINENVGFNDKQNCLLVEQGNEQSLSDAIEWAYKNQAKLRSIGKEGRKLFEHNFSTAQNAKKLQSII